MKPRDLILLVLVGCGALSPAAAQPATLDVLDGETLYEGGWLVTVGQERERRDELRAGGGSIADPLDRSLELRDSAFAVHYGARHDLQFSLLVPRVERSLTLAPSGGPATRLDVQGLGDVGAVAKWRFYRRDAPHEALNISLLVGLELPTGEDDARDEGLLLPPVLQPGRGSWNPQLGLAATYEPGRWRFNAVAFYTHAGGGGTFRQGDSLLTELSVGHRFWLEPYPGPFMRADLALRHRRDERVTMAGGLLPGPPLANDPSARPSGGTLTSVAVNWAFRPRPSLDLQVELEQPVAQHVEGQALGERRTLSLRVGYRY